MSDKNISITTNANYKHGFLEEYEHFKHSNFLKVLGRS